MAGEQPQDEKQPQQDELYFRRENLLLEKQKLTNEIRRTHITVGTIAGTVSAAFIAFMSSVCVQQRTADAALQLQDRTAANAFQLEVARIVMAGTAHEAKGKMDVLVKLFPKHLTPEQAAAFAAFDPNESNWGRASKNQFLTWIAAQPAGDQRRIIVDTYRAVFGPEKWLDEKVEKAATRG